MCSWLWPMTPDEVASLLESWTTHLQAERKSPHTIRTYTTGVRLYVQWCSNQSAKNGRLNAGLNIGFDRPSVEAFTAALLADGAEPGTALARQRGVRRFSAWLAEEGEIERDDLTGMRPPKQDDKMPAELSTGQVKALLATCGVKEFHDIRDTAIIRLMTESMVRSSELLSMLTTDVDIRAGTAIVRRGKGGKGRIVPFGPQTGRALDRYARARRRHKHAGSPMFWLGARGPLAYTALYATVKRRGARAGVDVHPHMLRATGAIRWRAAGGSVPGLLTVAGWSSLEMAQRYVRAAESRLAVDEAHRLDLGDL
jgi:site-specific recombinase XerC